MTPGMAPLHYAGPTALTHSKYASPQQRKAILTAMPSSVSSAVAVAVENTIGTKEQIAAADDANPLDTAPRNADAQLAVVQGQVLKAEVDKHTANFSRTVSSAVVHTRQLLDLIRASLQAEGVADTETVDNLWSELEQLFAAANDAKHIMPVFLEKQRNNMGLYHASMMNETIRETQDELNIQHKKVNIQHNLILEHQEAFQDYKAQTAAKLKVVEDLQDRVSRLTLEKGTYIDTNHTKRSQSIPSPPCTVLVPSRQTLTPFPIAGNFRTEIDKYKQLLEQEKASKVGDLQNVNALQKELEFLVTSKEQLLTEVDSLRSALVDLQGKMKLAEQQIIDRFTAELKSQADQLVKETQNTTNLKVIIKSLEGNQGTAQLEAEKLRRESRALTEKYKEQSNEYAQTFAVRQCNRVFL